MPSFAQARDRAAVVRACAKLGIDLH